MRWSFLRKKWPPQTRVGRSSMGPLPLNPAAHLERCTLAELANRTGLSQPARSPIPPNAKRPSRRWRVAAGHGACPCERSRVLGAPSCPQRPFHQTQNAPRGASCVWWRWRESNPRPRHAGWRLFHRLGPLLKPPGGKRTSRSGRVPPQSQPSLGGVGKIQPVPPSGRPKSPVGWFNESAT